MSTRYDPLDETKPAGRAPLEPVPKPRSVWLAVLAIVLTSLVGVGAAFGFDVCAATRSVGVELDACRVTPTPEPVSPAPAPAPDAPKEPEPE